MASGGSNSIFLIGQFFNWKRHFDAEHRAFNFLNKFGFLFHESGFRVLSQQCDCNRHSAHKKIVVGTNGTPMETCPYHFIIISGRLSSLSGGQKVILDADGVRRLIETTRIETKGSKNDE